VDALLSAAVKASVEWYDDVFASHGIPVERRAGLWVSRGTPPRWHSAVKTLRARVPTGEVIEAMARHRHGTVADSYADQDLSGRGFELLIDATWLHRQADRRSASSLPSAWSVLRDADLLVQWNLLHDTTGVLLPVLLGHRCFTFVARHDAGQLTGGAVFHDGGEAVDLSNVWSRPGVVVGWEELMDVAGTLHPGRDLTGYAWGEQLTAAQLCGFVRLGPQRVWRR
jgi:hypothetical protein